MTLKKPLLRGTKFIEDHPFLALYGSLSFLIVAIVLVNVVLRKPVEMESTANRPVRSVQTYQIGSSPRIKAQALIEKSGVITITALAPGVVQKLFVQPGTQVKKGQTLLTTSTNYAGGNAATIQRQIASRQLQNVENTFDDQKRIIELSREQAEKNRENTEELRKLSERTIAETKNAISLNEDMLKLSDAIIADLEATGGSQTSILTQKNTRTQIVQTLNNLRNTLRQNEYQTGTSNQPYRLADISKDIVLKQLAIQEQSLELSRDIARLQLSLARVQEGIMYPSSPFRATVQRVLVKEGQQVNPGTPLLILSQEIEEDPIVAIAFVSREVAGKISYTEPSYLMLDNTRHETYPSYISRDAVQGSLYAVYFPIPDSLHMAVTERGYVVADMPVGKPDTGSAVPYIPIESVYQTQDAAFVMLARNGIATSQEVTLGPVLGRYVAVTKGITAGDLMILDRDVVSGDPVAPQSQ